MPGAGETTCASCGSTVAAEARFCSTCGQPVHLPAAHESRRVVTLLFADVTGSTALGEQLDPEAYRGVMGQYFAVSQEVIGRHGGTIEKFVGDAVMAVFGVPSVHEDDALRAVRAADELLAALTELSRELERSHEVSLEVRIGVNTGAVVSGEARAGGSFATGDAVNVAARLEQAAAPGTILMGGTTYALVRDAVEVGSVAPVPAKGKAQPVVAHRLVAVRDTPIGRRRRLDAPLVGRDRERLALDETLDRTVATGQGHLVTVLGPPGVGKTRLVTAFLDRVGDRATVVTGRCVSYGQGITYWPVAQMLRQGLQLAGDESAEVVRHSIEQVMSGEADRDDVTRSLLAVLGHEEHPCSNEQAGWAVSRIVEQLASARPLVMNIDDLHWAEPTLLELLDQVREELEDLPLLVVCQARPELLDSRPHWGGGAMNSLTLGLAPFTQHETAAAMGDLLGAGVPEEAVIAVAERAAGNPLFVEELAGHLVEVGALQAVDGSWTVTGDLRRTAIPPTMVALLAARLDRLPEPERKLLERLSVIGLEFSTADAVALAEPDTDVPGLLSSLARRDVLRRVRGRGLDQWAFKHILVRDAAYDSLPKALRADLHQRFADVIESGNAEAAGDVAGFLAHHLEQAARHRAELHPHHPATTDLIGRAVRSLLAASDVALARLDHELAAGLIRRALALDTPVAMTRDLLVRLLEAAEEGGLIEEKMAILDEFEATFDETTTSGDLAFLECQRLLVRMTHAEDVDPADLEAAARRAADEARAARDDRRLAASLGAMCTASLMTLRWSEFAGATEEIRATGLVHHIRWMDGLRALYLWRGPGSARDYLAHVEAEARSTAMTPRYRARIALYRAQAMAALVGREARPLVEAAKVQLAAYPDESGHIEHVEASIAALLAEPAVAIERLDAVLTIRRRKGDLSVASTDLATKAVLMLEVGLGEAEVRPVVEEARALTSRYDAASLILINTADSVLAARAGDQLQAERLADEALRMADGGDDVWDQADTRRRLSAAALAGGDLARARRLLEEALDLYRAKEVLELARLTEHQLATLPEP